MTDTLRKEFEVTYRACFPIAAELQPNLFSFDLDDDEYVEAKVHVAFTLWQAARATAEQSEPVPINGADQRDAYEWAIQASCFENSDRSRSARRVFEDILAAVCPDASEAFSLADELDEISERITRFTNSSGDATVARTAQILREFASITLTGTASTAIAELQNFVAAKRFDRDTFANDTEFADWLLSRARHALKSQQDAAIESKQAGQSVPVLPTSGSFHTGVLVKLLLDSAFEILRPDSPEDCPEEPWMRVALGEKYWAILTAAPRSIESQRSGDGS